MPSLYQLYKYIKYIDIIYYFNKYIIKENLVKIIKINIKNNIFIFII